MGTIPPVKNQTLIAVPLGTFDDATGGLIAKFVDRPATAFPTSASRSPGRTTSSGTSDADGCAFWSGLPEGGYYVNVAQPGYVDLDGNNIDPPERHRHRRLDELLHLLLRPRGDGHRVVHHDGERRPAGRQGHRLDGRQQRHAVARARRRSASAPPATTITSGATLYPFTDGYVVWAGQRAQAPTRARTRSRPPRSASRPPAPSTVMIREPALNILVKRGTTPPRATTYGAATVRITPMTAGCGSTFGGTGLLNTAARPERSSTPGMPYGDYQVCVERRLEEGRLLDDPEPRRRRARRSRRSRS